MKRRQWSKVITLLVILLGFVIAQECLWLMYKCIGTSFGGSAAWLTAGVGLAETVMGAGLTGYLSLAKSDHSEGGITYEKAKAKNFSEEESV